MTEEMKFDKAMERLGKVVEDLESGEISLEDALKKYEEGVRLSRVCQKKLSLAEKKIEMLTRNLDGKTEKVPFEYEDEKNESSGKKASRKKTKKTISAETEAEDEEDLLL